MGPLFFLKQEICTRFMLAKLRYSLSYFYGYFDILAQADTHQPVVWHVGMMSIGVEGHALKGRIGGRCTEVRRFCIITPIVTLLVAIINVTRNEKA